MAARAIPVPAAQPTLREVRTQRRRAQELFKRGRQVELSYSRQLQAVAKHVGEIVRGFAPAGHVLDLPSLREMLRRYAELITPWARSVATRMLTEVSRKDASAWAAHGKMIGRALHREIMTAPTGETLRAMLAEQVDLITSLPREAAERVHELTLRGIENSTRAEQIAEEIERTGLVTISRARTIARTEVTRTATSLTAARATYIGSEEFVWHSVGDADVRPLHRRLNGHVFRWDDPPVSGENGETSLPGGIYNCRCWPEPIIPELV